MKLSLFLLVLPLSCTPPTHKIAKQAFDRAYAQEKTIVADLANISKQYAVENAASKIDHAVVTGDKDDAHKVLEELATRFEKIGWLQIQHERANRLFDLVNGFIGSRQGVLDILATEASKNVKKDPQ